MQFYNLFSTVPGGQAMLNATIIMKTADHGEVTDTGPKGVVTDYFAAASSTYTYRRIILYIILYTYQTVYI